MILEMLSCTCPEHIFTLEIHWFSFIYSSKMFLSWIASLLFTTDKNHQKGTSWFKIYYILIKIKPGLQRWNASLLKFMILEMLSCTCPEHIFTLEIHWFSFIYSSKMFLSWIASLLFTTDKNHQKGTSWFKIYYILIKIKPGLQRWEASAFASVPSHLLF